MKQVTTNTLSAMDSDEYQKKKGCKKEISIERSLEI